MKKLRFLSRLTIAFFKKRVKTIILGILLGIVFYFVFQRLIFMLPKPRKNEKIGIVGKINLSEIPANILAKISLGLTSISADGGIKPAVSDHWQVSSDGKIYTFFFTGKKNYWHDKSQFTPDDVNYVFKDVKIMAIDFQTLKIILPEPFSSFPYVVSQPLFKKGLIGLGPYKVGRVSTNGQILKSISLVPVEKISNLPNISYRFYLNDSYLKTAFKLGEIDKIEKIDKIGEFADWKNIVVNSFLSTDHQMMLFFNTAKDPFLEKSFRQAIAYALDKKTGKERAIGPISGSSLFFNPNVKKYDKDVLKAKQLLEKIKLTKDSVFSLYTFSAFESEAQKIKSNLEEIGLKTEIKLTSFIPEDFDMFLAIQEIPKDPDQYILWHTDQKLNFTHFSNPRIDKLLEDGRKVLDENERIKIYFDFQRFLVEETPAVFLYYPTYYSVERK